MTFTPQTGQRVQVRKVGPFDSHAPNPAYRGEVGTIKDIESNDLVWIAFDNERDLPTGDGGTWHLDNLVLLANESTPITFSLTKDTSREYARAAISTTLDEDAKIVLSAAANGEEVDLRAFQKALVQAHSAAATRYGQSMQRRALTKKIRHLSYIADAVLDKVLAEGLPLAGKVLAEPGSLAEYIEQHPTLEPVDLHITARLEDAVRQINANVEEIERLRQRAEEQEERGDAYDLQNTILSAEVTRLFKVSEFARSLLGEVDRAKVEGFIEGLHS